MWTAESHRRAILLQLLESMKDSVHEYEIGVRGIDAGRKDDVEVKMVKPPVAQSAEPIGKYPEEKGEQMRRGQTGNAMPEDALVGSVRTILEGCHLQIRDTLRVEMNLMDGAHCRAFDDFGMGALCAVLAVKKRGDDDEPQFSPAFEPLAAEESALLSRASADDRPCQGAATDRH